MSRRSLQARTIPSTNCPSGSGFRAWLGRQPFALLVVAVMFSATTFTATPAHAVNSLATFNAGASDLTSAGNYTSSGGFTPTAGSGFDIEFSNSTYTTPTFTANSANLIFGTLDDINTSQSLVITDNGTASSITLNGGSNAVPGAAAADLLYVASNGNLAIQSGSGVLTLDLNATGNIDNAGTLSLAGPISITAGDTITFTGNGATTVSGAIALSTGAITINNGTGSVTFSGNNLQTGTTTLTAGTLRATTSAGALGAGALSLGGGVLDLANASGANLAFKNATTVTGSAQITSDLTSGTAGNTYTLGTLSIGAQTLTIAGGSTITSGTAGVTFGATTLTGNATFTVNNPSGGGASLLTLASVTGTHNLAFGGTGNSSVGAITSSTGTVTMSGTGTATLTLSAANTYTGTTTVSSGFLVLSSLGGSLSGTSPLVVSSGATLTDNNAGNNTLPGTAAWTVAGTVNLTTGAAETLPSQITLNGGTLTSTATNATYGSYLGYATTITANGTGNIISAANFGIYSNGLTLTTPLATDTLSVSSPFGASSALGPLTKSGLGTVTLSGANTYTGATTINGGTLLLNYSTNASVLSSGSALHLGGGTLNVQGNSTVTTSQTLASLALTAGTSSGIVLNPNGGGGTTLTITSATVTTGVGAALNFNLSAGTTDATTSTLGNTIVAWNPTPTSGIIGGGYTVTDTGGTGFATISSGKVVRLVDTGSPLPTGTGSSTANYFASSTYSTTVTTTPGSLVEALSSAVAANTVTVDTTGLSSGANLALGANTLTLTSGGGIVFAGANPYAITGAGGLATSAAAGSMVFNNYNSNTVTIGAPILNNGANTVAFAGTGTTILSGNNLFSGGATLGSGTLDINSTTALGAAAGTFAINGGTIDNTNATGTLINNNPISIGGSFNFGGSNPLNLGTGAVSAAGNYTITLNGNNPLTLGGALTNTAANGTAITTTINNGSGTGASTALDLGGFNLANTGNTTAVTDILSGSGSVDITGAVANGGSGASVLTYGGTGVLTLGGADTYSGGTVVNGGTVLLGSTTALGSTSAALTVNGGILDIATFSPTVGTLTLDGGTIQSTGSTTAKLTASSLNGVQYGTVTANLSSAATWSVAGSSAPIILSGAANSFARIDINQGTLEITGGNTTLSSYFTTNSAGTETGNYLQTGGIVTVNNYGVYIDNSGGASTFTISGGTFNQTTTGDYFRLGQAGGTSTLNLSGGGVLNAYLVQVNTATTGTATINLGDGSTFSGGTSILNGGTSGVLYDNGNNQAHGTGTLYFNGGTLKYAGVAAESGGSSFGYLLGQPAGPLTNVYVSTAGGIIDNGGFATEINQGLLHNPGLSGADGGMVFQGAGTTILSASNTYNGATTVNAGTLSLTGSLTGSSVTVNGASAVFNESTTGVIAGTGTTFALTTGSATFSGANTYTGATTVTAGTLQVGSGINANSGSIATASAITINSNGTVTYASDGAGITIGNTFSGSGALNFTGPNAVDQGYYALSANNSTFTGTLTASGARIADANGSNNFGGATIDVLSTGQVYAVNSTTYTNNLTLNGNGWLDSSPLILGALRMSNNTWAGSITLASNSRITDYAATSASITGNISGAYQLELGGGGTSGNEGTITLTPNAGNTFGSLLLSNGIVVAGNANAFASGMGLTVNAGTLELKNNSFSFANLSGTAGTIGNYGTSAASTITVGSDGTPTAFGGTLVNGSTSTLALAKIGAGTLTLSGTTSSYTGGTTINAGTISIAADAVSGNAALGAVPGSASPDNIVLNGGALSAGATLLLNSNRGIGLGPTAGTTGGIGTLDVATLGQTFTYNGIIASAGNSGTNTLTKTGPGILALGGASTDTGVTNVSAGTLNLTGSLASTSANVASGATLTGTGSMTSAALTVSGGGTLTLAFGNSANSLSVGSLTLGSSGAYYTTPTSFNYATLNFAYGSSGFETLNDAGALTANNVYVNITGALTTGSYTLINLPPSTAINNNFSLSSTAANISSIDVGRQVYSIIDNTTASTLTLTVSGAANPPVAYWDGAAPTTAWNDTSTSVVNWSSDPAGLNDAGNIPGPVTDVVLTAGNQAGSTTTLGGNLTVNSLTVNGNGTSTVNQDTGASNALTILAAGSAGGGLNYGADTTGIMIQSGASAFTFNAGLTVGGTQTWANQSVNTFTVGGAVTGSASSGSQILTLQNTSTGSTILSGIIGDGTNGGKLALVVNDSGAGTTTISNTNTYSGGTTLDQGLLSFANGSLGSGPINIAGSATLQWNGSNTQDISSQLSLANGITATFDTNGNPVSFASGIGNSTSAALTKIGAGTLTLAGTNTYTGATTISLGTLQIGAGAGSGSLASSTISVASGATLAFDRNDSAAEFTIANNVSGSGNWTFTSPGGTLVGRYTLTGSNSGYTGAMTIDHSRVIVASTSELGSAAVTVNAVGQLYANGGGPYTNALTLNSTGWIESASTFGALRLDASANWSGNILLTGNSAVGMSATGTISGVISDANGGFGIAKVQSGTLTLTGPNTYTGVTTLSAGILNLGSAESVGVSGPLGNQPYSAPGTIVFGGGTLQYSSANNNDYSGRFSTAASQAYNIDTNGQAVTFATGLTSNGGALVKIGAGTLTLGGANTYTGLTNIDGGTLSLPTGTSVSTATYINVGGGTAAGALSIAGGSFATSYNSYSFYIGNGSNGTFTMSSGSVTLTGAASGIILGNSGTAQWTQTGGSVTLAGNGGFYFGNGALGYNSELDISGGAITATSSTTEFAERANSILNVSNSAVVTLGPLVSGGTNTASVSSINLGNGTFSGGSSIATGGTSGVLALGTMSRASGTLNFNFDGGTLRATSSQTGFMPAATATTASVEDYGGVIDNASFNITIAQVFAHGGIGSTDGGLTFDSTGAGTGTTILSGANTYNGPTVVNAGTLTIAATGSVASGSVNVASGATFTVALNGGIAAGTALTDNGTVNLNNAAMTIGSLNGSSSLLTLNSTAVTVSGGGSYSGVVQNGGSAGSLIVGGGTLTLAGANTYTGATTISAGTLQLGNAAAVQNSTVNIGVANGLTFTPSIGNGTFLLGGLSGSANESLQDTGGGAVNLQVGGNGASTAYSGNLSGIGSLTVAGAGVLTLSGSNNIYSGGTAIQNGTLRAGGTNALPVAGTVTFGAMATNGTLDLNGYGLTVGGLAVASAASSNAASQIITNSNTSNVGPTATLTYAGATPSTFGGTLKDGSNGLLALTVSSGALTLTGANTYSGATAVTGGTLRVANTTGSATGPTGSVSVSSGATLSGGGGSTPGIISGSVNILGGGTIAPSGGGSAAPGSIGKLTVGALTLTSNGGNASQLDYQYNGSGSPTLDEIAVTNALTLPTANNGTPVQFSFYPVGSTSNQTLAVGSGPYYLMTYGSPGAGFTLAALSVNPNDLSGGSAVFSVAMVDDVNTLELNIVSTNASASWVSTGISPTDSLYGNSNNWSPTAVPSGIGQVATFGTGSQLTVSVNGAYTVGQLNFNDSIASASYYLTGNGSLTLNNSGSGASVNVSSGGLSPAIATTLVLADASLTTTFNVASGSSLDLSGTINESTPTGQQIVLSGGGVLTMEGSNNFTGGTTIQNGTLVANASGVLGTGSLTFNPGSGNTAALDVNTSMTVNNLSEPSTSLGTAQLNVASSTTLTLNQTASATFAGTLSLGGSAALTLNQGSGNTLTISGAPTLASLSSVLVNSGTLALTNNTNSPATVVGSASVSVASGATLQLAGSQAALSSAVNITTQGSGSAGDGALMVVGTTNQTVGVVSGNTVGSGPVTMYSGNTTVGDGTNAANLTATQILQNTLTINAGSTVTIAPSGSGIQTEDDVSAATAISAVSSSAVASSTATADSDSSSDPFTAIQAAIASGSISSAKGQQLENRIAEIEQLATTDPGLDVSILEDRVLAMLPSPSVWSSTGAGSSSSPLGETGSGLLAVDSSTFGSSTDSTSGSAAAAAFAPSAAFGGGPAAVPEPSTLLLAALGAMGMALVARRKTFANLLLLGTKWVLL